MPAPSSSPSMSFVPCLRPPVGADVDHAHERWFYVRGDAVLVCDGPAELPLRDQHFLGMLGARPCWAGDVEPPEAGNDDGSFMALRALWGRVSEVEWTVAGRAVQIVEWDRTHRYCGRCGSETALSTEERSHRCPHCGLTAFPRLAPAIIVLIERDTSDGGREALLARGRQFPLPMYSCLAGFVEPGETLEDAVHREIREEVGIEVDDVRYIASQPWPFPHSLMLGFTAQWSSGDIVIDETEIADAAWYRADALPMVPPGMSIARRLIDAWVARETA